ncbi:hypothetical protein LINPERPRIM_LOCUS25826 [Linum perenne]
MELKHEPTPFSKEQAGALEKLFSKMMSKAPQPNPPDIYSGVFANRGNQISAYSVNSTQCDQWIIDSGCSDHMTGSKELLDDYQCYPKKAGVRIADGSLSPVEGIGRVRITKRNAPGGRLELVDYKKISSLSKGALVMEDQVKGRVEL